MSKLQQIETLLAFQLPNCFSFKTFDILLSRRLALLTHLESEFAISVQRLSAPNITVTSASVRWTLLMSGCVSVTSDPMLAKEAAAVQVSPSLSLHGSNLTKLSSTRRSKCQSMQITVARSAPIFFSVCRAKHFSRLQTAFMLFSNVW